MLAAQAAFPPVFLCDTRFFVWGGCVGWVSLPHLASQEARPPGGGSLRKASALGSYRSLFLHSRLACIFDDLRTSYSYLRTSGSSHRLSSGPLRRSALVFFTRDPHAEHLLSSRPSSACSASNLECASVLRTGYLCTRPSPATLVIFAGGSQRLSGFWCRLSSRPPSP